MDASRTPVANGVPVPSPKATDGSAPRAGDTYFGSFTGGDPTMTVWSVPIFVSVAPADLPGAGTTGTMTLDAQVSGLPECRLQITDSSLFVYTDFNIDTGEPGSVSDSNVFLACAVINSAPDDLTARAFAPSRVLMGIVRPVLVGGTRKFVFVPSDDSVVIGKTRYLLSVIEIEALDFDPNARPYPPRVWPKTRFWEFANKHNPYLDVRYTGESQPKRRAQPTSTPLRSGACAPTQAPKPVRLDQQTTSRGPLASNDPRKIGPFTVIRRIGSGGMGQVYLARSPGGRKLAVKVIRSDFADDPQFRRRFRQEVSAARRVGSIYTAPIVDCDTDAEQPWIATAFVEGQSLDQLVASSGPLDRRRLLQLGAGVAEALRDIHAAGLIHRDIKPSNVLLAPDGPRIIDFGIAAIAMSSGLTVTGMMVGTPTYMAPEQIMGDAIGPPADIFAFGALMYYAATGKSAFGDAVALAIMHRIVNGEPSLEDCPAWLEPLIRACLAKDPAQRPALDDIISHLNWSGTVGPWQ